MQIKPSVNRLYAKNIREVNLSLAKRSTLIAVVGITPTECPNCIYDAANQCSTGMYKANGPQPFDNRMCPVCGGKGILSGEKQIRVQGNVRWGRAAADGNLLILQGDVKQNEVKIKVLQQDYSTMYTAKYYIIDGTRCTRVGEPTKRGLLEYVITEFRAQIDD